MFCGCGPFYAFSLAEQARLQDSIARVFWLLSIGGLLFSGLISFVLARGLSRPIERLKDAAEKVGKGDFTVALDLPSHDEIGQLADSFNKMTEVVYTFGGVVDKYVGDELMVLFGAPLQAEDDVDRAYQCAKRMVERRRELNAGLTLPLNIGIGMAHGPMVAGCMGSETRLNYTVLGDRVNLAARLCSQAGPMEIVVDSVIRRRVGLDGNAAEGRTLPLKGFVTSPPFYVIKSKKT